MKRCERRIWPRGAASIGLALLLVLASVPHLLLGQGDALVRPPLVNRGFNPGGATGNNSEPGLVPLLVLDNSTPNRGDALLYIFKLWNTSAAPVRLVKLPVDGTTDGVCGLAITVGVALAPRAVTSSPCNGSTTLAPGDSFVITLRGVVSGAPGVYEVAGLYQMAGQKDTIRLATRITVNEPDSLLDRDMERFRARPRPATARIPFVFHVDDAPAGVTSIVLGNALLRAVPFPTQPLPYAEQTVAKLGDTPYIWIQLHFDKSASNRYDYEINWKRAGRNVPDCHGHGDALGGNADTVAKVMERVLQRVLNPRWLAHCGVIPADAADQYAMQSTGTGAGRGFGAPRDSIDAEMQRQQQRIILRQLLAEEPTEVAGVGALLQHESLDAAWYAETDSVRHAVIVVCNGGYISIRSGPGAPRLILKKGERGLMSLGKMPRLLWPGTANEVWTIKLDSGEPLSNVAPRPLSDSVRLALVPAPGGPVDSNAGVGQAGSSGSRADSPAAGEPKAPVYHKVSGSDAVVSCAGENGAPGGSRQKNDNARQMVLLNVTMGTCTLKSARGDSLVVTAGDSAILEWGMAPRRATIADEARFAEKKRP